MEVIELSSSFIYISFLFAAAVVTDVLYGRIPNVIVLWAFLNGIFAGVCNGNIIGTLMNTGFALLISLPLYVIGAVGAGDVKAFVAAGTFIEYGIIIHLGVSSLIFTALYGIVFKLWKKQRGFTKVAMAPGLFLGSIVTYMIGGIR